MDTHGGPLTLVSAVARLAEAESAPDVLRLLLEHSVLAGPRGVLLLLRRGRLQGWSARGYSGAEAQALRRLDLAPDEPPWSSLLSAAGPPLPVAGDALPGCAHAEEALAVRLAAARRPLGVLVVARMAGEPPLRTEPLALLAVVACLRLELDLAWRKLRADAPKAPAAPEVLPQQPAATSMPAAGKELAPSHFAAQSEDPKLEEARRFARLVATDIRLYHEEDVVLGRRERDLARRLRDELERGRETFQRRFPDLGEAGLSLLREAYIHVLAGGDPSLLPGEPA